jgi:histidyl-tRNA synthetase
MDYYNRSVFEWVSTALGGEITITGGGRYDGLFEQLGGKSTPACGFGLGLERVMLIWQASLGDSQPAGMAVPDAYIVHVGEGTEAAAFRLSEQLRDAGLHCILHAGGGSFKSQLKKADASHARFTLILGESELATGQVAVKNMATGVQTVHALLDVPALVTTLMP